MINTELQHFDQECVQKGKAILHDCMPWLQEGSCRRQGGRAEPHPCTADKTQYFMKAVDFLQQNSEK